MPPQVMEMQARGPGSKDPLHVQLTADHVPPGSYLYNQPALSNEIHPVHNRLTMPVSFSESLRLGYRQPLFTACQLKV